MSNESAFPTDYTFKEGRGLSKREAIAIAALQGLLACPHQMCGDIENQTGLAVEYADRLLAELARVQS